MYQEISNEMFVKEMRLLWQNTDNDGRDMLSEAIYEYFEGLRAEKIINKMQETIS